MTVPRVSPMPRLELLDRRQPVVLPLLEYGKKGDDCNSGRFRCAAKLRVFLV